MEHGVGVSHSPTKRDCNGIDFVESYIGFNHHLNCFMWMPLILDLSNFHLHQDTSFLDQK